MQVNLQLTLKTKNTEASSPKHRMNVSKGDMDTHSTDSDQIECAPPGSCSKNQCIANNEDPFAV